MQSQKFDATKPHGTIWGHPNAQYEQGGFLFDGAGFPVLPEENGDAEDVDHSDENSDPGESSEVLFIKNILSGGPVAQVNVKRESENQNLIWSRVQDAAIFLQVEKIRQGSFNVWKLA